MELPMHLISDNILSRLPVKSLFRFKTVSKSWNALIKSPYFIEKHQNMADIIHTLPSSALLNEIFYENWDTIGLLNLIEAPDKRITLDLPFLNEGVVHVLGISNGLVCMMNSHDPTNIIIFNPATREFRKIPPCKKSAWQSHLNYFGFGLLANGYELIRIASDAHGTKANSYSMDTNTWRDLHVKVCRPDTRPALFMTRQWHTNVPVLQNGVFYWDTCYDRKVFVTSFNVSNEVLEEIPAPPVAYNTVWKLIGLKEEVAIVISRTSQWFDVWVLNEKEKTWTMKHSVKGDVTVTTSPDTESYVTVLGGTKSGELLMTDHYSETSKVFSYNMDSGYVDFFPFVINGVAPIGNEELFFYNESLTSVRIGDNVVEDVLDSPMMKRTMKKEGSAKLSFLEIVLK